MSIPSKYRQVKRAVISALRSGKFEHEARSAINVKKTGQVTAQFVEVLVTKSDGTQYSSSPHHNAPAIDVHIIESGGWYVKFYFVGDPETVFISVHQ
ncbi:hypothetical protein R69927_00173 [Paraburkholderia domus]|uniref:Uncharacterized protein n=1 Tax=Paraburkholderia domus TaxID=2793075 RepID=A0A9N8MRQ8_9BURK|nr:hypothetical protein [Paraburkholderia domus]MBK5047638.1 hypothetical protein [Burkholderia sp. R-70006]MBK5062742.1 hypothetical protein [Burkholderia sp. R-70199]MBK5084869.1 hypothetical protein [Burkholderia sp. R-69927]MBK5163911.1 hypothetical protein [Burkholderia sp. R-70211]MBK5178769.1 hypothetical protein [Burkholderia sp. R-69749]MCI0148484.1 hypothetical protein [Paraburkholderia sediminicola]